MSLEPKAIHPGKILLDEVMRPLGVSRNRLARDIDVPVGRVSAIVSGSRAITADTALRLAKYFGTTAELWLKLQADYELAVARAGMWKNIDPRVRVFDARQVNVPADAAEEPVPAAPAASTTPVGQEEPVGLEEREHDPDPVDESDLEHEEPASLELTERLDPPPFNVPRRTASDAQPDEPIPFELTNRVDLPAPTQLVAATDTPFEPEYWDEDEPEYETDDVSIPEPPKQGVA